VLDLVGVGGEVDLKHKLTSRNGIRYDKKAYYRYKVPQPLHYRRKLEKQEDGRP